MSQTTRNLLRVANTSVKPDLSVQVGKHSTGRVGSGRDLTALIFLQFAVVFSPPIPACLQLEKYFQFYSPPLYWILV